VRVLLDENPSLDFAAEIRGHDVHTVRGLGWTGVENGELMRRAATACDVFVTMDRNLPHQQHVVRLPFGVILLRAQSNRLLHLRPLIAALLRAIETIKAGELQASVASKRLVQTNADDFGSGGSAAAIHLSVRS
jgi:predicted nuclease of predicted toxin-antitoxin system